MNQIIKLTSIAIAFSILLFSCKNQERVEQIEEEVVQKMQAEEREDNAGRAATATSCCGYIARSCNGVKNISICCKANGIDNGNCVWWVWDQACANWGVGFNIFSNANTWATRARDSGFVVTRSCGTNTIGVSNTGSTGHVAWVTNCNSNKVANKPIEVTEMNCTSSVGMRSYPYASNFFNLGFIRNCRLTSNIVTISPSTFYQYNSINISAGVSVSGTENFVGKIKATLYNANNALVGDIQNDGVTYTINKGTTRNFNFVKNEIVSTPGNYKIKVEFLPSDGFDWGQTAGESKPLTILGCQSNQPSISCIGSVASIKVSWAKQSAATFVVEYRLSGTTAWKQIQVSGTTFITTINSLIAGQTYQVRLRKDCTAGTSGLYSSTVSVKTL
jgi:surface antigen